MKKDIFLGDIYEKRNTAIYNLLNFASKKIVFLFGVHEGISLKKRLQGN